MVLEALQGDLSLERNCKRMAYFKRKYFFNKIAENLGNDPISLDSI